MSQLEVGDQLKVSMVEDSAHPEDHVVIQERDGRLVVSIHHDGRHYYLLGKRRVSGDTST